MTIWHFGTSHSLGAGIFAEDKKHLHGDGNNNMRRYEQKYITPFLVQKQTNCHVHNFAVAGVENGQIIWTLEKALQGIYKFPKDPNRPKFAVFELRSHPDHGTIPISDDMINTKFSVYYTALVKFAKMDAKTHAFDYTKGIEDADNDLYGPQSELQEYLCYNHTLAGTYHHSSGTDAYMEYSKDQPVSDNRVFNSRGTALLHDGLNINVRNTLRKYANAVTDSERLELHLGAENAEEIMNIIDQGSLADLVITQLPNVVAPYIEKDHPIWTFDFLSAITRSKAAFIEWNHEDNRGRKNSGHASPMHDRWCLSKEIHTIRSMCHMFEVQPIFYWIDNTAMYVNDAGYDPVNHASGDMIMNGMGMSQAFANEYGAQEAIDDFKYCVCGHWGPRMHAFIADKISDKIHSFDK